MPIGREQGRDKRRDEQRVLEEVRRLLERYRVTARRASSRQTKLSGNRRAGLPR